MKRKFPHILKAGLDTLYFETMQWMLEVEFYLYEFHALEELVRHKKANDSLAKQLQKDIRLTIYRLLNGLSRDYMKNLTKHEKICQTLSVLSDNDYLPLFLIRASATSAQSVLEKWKTVDDKGDEQCGQV